jgi:hypothetical protein
MTWRNVLSTQEIKQDSAETVNNTLWTNSACRTDSSETDKKPHSQNLSWNTIAVCDTLTCFQVLRRCEGQISTVALSIPAVLHQTET